MAKVSIIIPVYNMEKYLRQSLDSVINQTLQDLEIICINDGSCDSSLEILKEYAEKDNRIKIINQENQGQGIARNNGIEIATGEYLGFVDPDDWIEPDMYEKAYKTLKDNNLDFVEISFAKHYENKVVKKETRLPIPNKKIYNTLDYPSFIFNNDKMTACDKVYKTDFIKKNNIRFRKGQFAEDQIFVVKVRCLAKKSLYINEALYHYRILSSSITRGYCLDRLNRAKSLSEIRDFLINSGLFKELSTNFYEFCVDKLSYNYARIPNEQKAEYDNAAQELLPEELFDEYNKRKLSKKTFLELLFSLRNNYSSKGKTKVLTILGFEIKLDK